jgi:sulfhydrogenase subunit beta (sulfur reductase)
VDLLVFQLSALDQLLDALADRGFRLIGPVVADGAICYDDIASAADLPAQWTDEQDAGRYRLRRRPPGDEALFGYAVGPHSWKKFLFPPSARLLPPEDPPDRPFAFIGVRPCELAAIAIQDRIFLGGAHPDPQYAQRRKDAFIVAVNCGEPSGSCFCASMGTGPRAEAGFDIALTELNDDGGHRFLAQPGSERGEAVLGGVSTRSAAATDVSAARTVTIRARAAMGRTMPQLDLRQLLYDNTENPRWDDVASRCLACGNCTTVCPTCFCFSVTDTTDLAGVSPRRHRTWDSCFTPDHSYLHGGSVRRTVRARYRQWLTHKLATWADQFGTPGCVGCGRCITWCPAAIDITEEVAAIATQP